MVVSARSKLSKYSANKLHAFSCIWQYAFVEERSSNLILSANICTYLVKHTNETVGIEIIFHAFKNRFETSILVTF